MSAFAGRRRGVIYHVPPHVLGIFRGIGEIMCFHGERQNVINPNRSLESLTDFVRLLSRCADVSSKA